MVSTPGRKKLAAFLEKRGLHQAEAARALGITRSVFGHWMAGTQRPRPELREVISRWTDGEVPADSWFTAEERKQIDAIAPFVPTASAGA